ncbi:flagellar hook-basal body complex protein FliE [Anaerosalibacter sp. Marseille-P3206]|uniref:flagellar hook-basal body complex protein FliE n=1 Tax=Anaerosalibacter sp. Marseille-P3206 TaxID=1871005 RepID=UPI00098665C3|nr:flagellar hook-basal body complex protein FliE [Anaerosalibacter sp. Marseille-P3206]
MKIGAIPYSENKIFNTIDNNNSSKDVEMSFGQYLKNAIGKVNDLQIEAQDYKKLLATGEVDDLHSVMIAAEKANIALQFTMGIRTKVVDAYREIMRMQL